MFCYVWIFHQQVSHRVRNWKHTLSIQWRTLDEQSGHQSNILPSNILQQIGAQRQCAEDFWTDPRLAPQSWRKSDFIQHAPFGSTWQEIRNPPWFDLFHWIQQRHMKSNTLGLLWKAINNKNPPSNPTSSNPWKPNFHEPTFLLAIYMILRSFPRLLPYYSQIMLTGFPWLFPYHHKYIPRSFPTWFSLSWLPWLFHLIYIPFPRVFPLGFHSYSHMIRICLYDSHSYLIILF